MANSFKWRTYALAKTQNVNLSNFYKAKVGSVNVQNNTGSTIRINQVPVVNGRLFVLDNFSDASFTGDLEIEINQNASSGSVYIYAQIFDN
jgi:hypothetical protein